MRENTSALPDGPKAGAAEAPSSPGVVMTCGFGAGSVNVLRGRTYTSDLVVVAGLSVGSFATNAIPAAEIS